MHTGKTKKVDVPESNKVWIGDITYIRTNSGFMYFSAIIDWHSKDILSYRLSNVMDSNLFTDTLEDALIKYPVPDFFNSDQGNQYTIHNHANLLKHHGIKISMNGKGRSINNIVMDRFFRTLKYDFIFMNDFKTIMECPCGGIKELCGKKILANTKDPDLYWANNDSL